ncbi:hypothetical protein ANO11243_045200 [Dothideomycetidae sp. 11243]|nr:hypothetical protein ANO11243_045200 [fungal sp. No.11243]
MLRALVNELDISPGLWRGDDCVAPAQKFDLWASPDESSLHWIFNNNPSPKPDSSRVKDDFKRQAIDDILHNSISIEGLKTSLYPYQRRTAAFMLQRESESRKYLDPRFEARTAPDGSKFFYCARDFLFFRYPVMYEAGKGGILAETMGLGKTIITLSLILSTRGFLPKTPIEYSTTTLHPTVRSLMDMCVQTINRQAIPWKLYFKDYEARTGESLTNCMQRLRNSKTTYEIPRIPIRFNRTTTIPPPSIKTLAATTIVVVPRNLCSQWEAEIEKHTEAGALSVLVMDDLRYSLPDSDRLRQYDVILFSRNRFEQESRDGSDEQEDIYDSPLKKLHFLRIIIDEGHSFSSSTSLAATVAERLVTADHRWVVSGTPAKNLLGVEMDLYSSDQAPMPLNDKVQRDKLLVQRKQFNASEDAQGAVKSLGSLVTHFLQVRPWSGGGGERAAVWEEYIYRHEDFRKKTFTSFSRALRQTLEAVVIKTRPDDVEKDLDLPPLTHTVVKLNPSFYDKVIANLFTLVLTANAVTSERTDRDYLFHKDSAKARYQLIGNLRQSAFFWTGFSAAEIQKTIEQSERYLEKDDIKASEEDRLALQKCIAMARRILELKVWNCMSATHEFGLLLENWPEDSAEHWTFDGTEPVMTGASLLASAQEYVHSRLSTPDLDLSLAGEGIKKHPDLSARHDEPVNSPPSKTDSAPPSPTLPEESPLHQTRIIGTVSAKMSYLLSRILSLYKSEKILVFYTGDNAAYYLAQCLERLHIPHLIYARTLAQNLKAQYLVNFNQRAHFRVLLMEVNQAAYGLNVPTASRVFFINPVCRPAIEAQAIKRAHRIGQEREVFVETLVLAGSREEAIWQRARDMTRSEHAAAKNLEDDGGVVRAVVEAELLPLEEGLEARRACALLHEPQRLWCRPGWRTWNDDRFLDLAAERKRKRAISGAGEEGDAAVGKKRKMTGVDIIRHIRALMGVVHGHGLRHGISEAAVADECPVDVAH